MHYIGRPLTLIKVNRKGARGKIKINGVSWMVEDSDCPLDLKLTSFIFKGLFLAIK
jgi:hypothetical protein